MEHKLFPATSAACPALHTSSLPVFTALFSLGFSTEPYRTCLSSILQLLPPFPCALLLLSQFPRFSRCFSRLFCFRVLGAGKAGDGAMDAANLLKPMLARGELRTIGATTLAEYRSAPPFVRASVIVLAFWFCCPSGLSFACYCHVLAGSASFCYCPVLAFCFDTSLQAVQ